MLRGVETPGLGAKQFGLRTGFRVETPNPPKPIRIGFKISLVFKPVFNKHFLSFLLGLDSKLVLVFKPVFNKHFFSFLQILMKTL
ncbi:hypothetical protein HanIR_Chr12g0604921 [Helianthus annuus]|nr:hypothetical protein HanIR_Chr12g0604921 [Helianthus annuus]